MNKWFLKSGLAALLSGVALMASAADPVALLQQLQGKVFISQGKAMVPAQPGIAVYPGNRVVTAAGGGVSVVYTDGCKVVLPENSLLVLGDRKQCEAGLARVRTIGSFQNARIGQAPPPIADLKRLQKDVRVNQEAAQNNMDLRRDDQIVTGKESKATVVFRSCEVEVGPEEQVTVDELRARCTNGVFLASGGEAGSEIAIIKRPQGSVMVDKSAAQSNMDVYGNSQISTGAGSKVTVVFKACQVVVGADSQVKVGDLVTQCTGGLWAAAGAGSGAGGAAGVAGAASVAGVPVGAAVIGGAGIILVGAAIGNTDNGAASPQ